MGDLLNLTIYNPALLSDKDFLASFVARRTLADQLLKRFRELTLTNLAHHFLLLGQRGMGKTSLLRRLALGVEEDDALSEVLLPLTFREEQYNVHNLQVFWCNCLDALGDWFDRTGQSQKANEIDEIVSGLIDDISDQDGTIACEKFVSIAKREKRRPILFLDNIDIILDGLRKDQWSLRRILQQAGGIVVVGASANYLEAMADKKAAFYDFFQVTVLEKLSHVDLVTCLRHLAEARGPEGQNVLTVIESDPGRIHTLYDLTGGNPRTLTILYLLLELDSDSSVFSDLERLLDQVTVLYKARVEDLAPQARVVLDALALEWNPISAANIATAARLPTSTVSTHLDRMRKDGLVEKVTVTTTSRAAFQLSERFFNIWYLMRHAPRRQRTRLRWLTSFLRTFYTPKQLTDRARDFLRLEDNQGLDRREYCLALSDAVDDPGWRNLLGYEAVRELEHRASKNIGTSEEDAPDVGVATPTTAKEWVVQGRLLARDLQRYEDAELAYQKAIDLEPTFVRAWERLASLLQYDLDRYNDAEIAYRKAIELDAKSANAWFGLGNLLQFRLGRYSEAEEAYRAAIDSDSNIARSWSGLGSVLLYRTERYEEAEEAYRKAVEIDSNLASAWAGLGILLQRQAERAEESEDAYRKAIEIDPNQAGAWIGLGVLLQHRFGRIEEAESAYQRVIEIDPGIAGAWGFLGDLLAAHTARVDESEEAFRKAIELDSNWANPWLGLADLLRDDKERYVEAEEAYRRAIDLDSNWAAPWAHLGDLLQFHSERYQEAEDAYRTAIAINPKWAGAHHSLGFLLRARLERYDEAEEAYRAAIAADPNWAAPWSDIGDLLRHNLDRLDESEAAYRKAIEVDSTFVPSWIGLGNLLAEEPDRAQEAEKVFRSAIKVNPKSSRLWAGLGTMLHYNLEKYTEAQKAYRRSIKLDPDSADAWSGLGDLFHYRLDRYVEAEKCYRRAIDARPNWARSWRSLGYLLQFHLQRYDEAEDAFRSAVEIEESVSTWSSLGDLLQNQLGRSEDALDAYGQAIATSPTSKRDWAVLGYLLFYLFDRREEAKQAYQRALVLTPNDLVARSNLLALHLIDPKTRNSVDEEYEALVEEHPVSGAALLEAIREIARENFGGASKAFRSALLANDPDMYDTYRGFFVLFLRLATSGGYGNKLLRFFEDSGLSDRYWPVYASLDAYINGEARLTNLNPEVRGVANHLYSWLSLAKVVPPEQTLGGVSDEI